MKEGRKFGSIVSVRAGRTPLFYLSHSSAGMTLRDRERDVVDEVCSILQPLLQQYSLELFDIVYRTEGGGKVLRVFIDKEGGVTVEDCAALSRELGALLDVYDVVPGTYTLEVSSPGLTRPLRKPSDFLRFVGRKVKLRTSEAFEGRRVIVGRLTGFADMCARVEVERKAKGKGKGVSKELSIPYDKIERANLEVEL